MHLKSTLFKQYHIPLLGELKTTANSAAFYLSVLTVINTAATPYEYLRPWFTAHASWVSLPVFMSLEFFALLPFILLIQYKFGLRAEYRFGNIQSFNESPVKPILERMEGKQNDMQKQLDRIEKKG